MQKRRGTSHKGTREPVQEVKEGPPVNATYKIIQAFHFNNNGPPETLGVLP